MAECSYARCLQERRLIKRELMKHSKDMLQIAGLERVAEELMGRRKWKQYQETLMRTHLNSDQFVASIEDNNIELKKELDKFKNGEFIEISETIETQNLEENHRKDIEINTITQQQQKEQEHEIFKETQVKEQEKETETEIEKNKHHIKTENKFEQLEEGEDKKNTKEFITASQNQKEATVITNYNNNNNSSLKTANNTAADITVKDLKLETETSAKSPSTSPPPPPDPIDWKPNDKCHFCVNGKLLTVNAKGELVAESGPTGSETDHIQRLDCESDSNESSSVAAAAANTNGNLPLMTGAGPLTENNRVTLNKLLTQKMASMDSVAAQFAAIQSILPNFNWMNQQQQQSQPDSVTPTTSDTSAAAISPSLKDSPSPSDATGEQPLDLSSKPSPNSSVSGDLKSVRIKSSRATPVPSTRRTYSEEDLNNALQEIVSGRLGTRKAAVQFNVPRSTLRNKIYKLTTEAKRHNEQASPELLLLQQELEKEMSGDDEPDMESNASTPQPDDVVVTRISTPNLLKKLCINNGESAVVNAHPEDQATLLHASPKPAHVESSKPQTAEGLPEHNTQAQITALEAALPLLLQTLLLSDKNLRDVFSALLLNSTNNLKDIVSGATTAANNAAAASGNDNNSLNNGNQQQDYRPLLQLLLQQQQQQHQQPTSFASGRRLPKSDTPETNSSLDPNEACDDPSAILKIPSYTPVAGPSNTMGPSSSRGSPALLCHNSNSNSNRNGDSPGPLLLAAAVNAAQKLSTKNLPVTPPLLHSGVDNQPPQSLRMSDVIANSIHRTMNEQANKDAVHAGSVSLLSFAANSERNSMGSLSTAGDYKKPTISVVKNIGGTDTSRFGTAPNLLAADLVQHHHHAAHLQHAHHHLSRQEAAALAAGKGTRPKRGKYRNYDRDSLVEAVKAVQRGEMSVHRAGSYYGVPHSTLEYKVKERHLMRPRKREPKPQPGLDGSSNSSKTNANIPAGLTGLDKLKAGNGGTNANLKLSGAGMKNNGGTGANAFPGNTANGMKLPMFDPALAHLPYTSPLFWQHNQAAAFSQLQMDFNRNSTAPSATSPNEASSDILKSHMQRYQDMTGGGGGGGASSVGGNTTTNSSNGPSPVSSPILSGQDINRARELYESNAANGASFLDGIIRKTLDRKSNEVNAASTSASGGVLLDQLLMKKTPLPFTNNRSNEYNSLSPSHLGAMKRSGSPLSLSGTSIKRERNSPHSGAASDDDDETSQSGVDESYENNNNKSGNGGMKTSLSQRSRLGSRDSNSETDNSSLKSELQMSNHHHQHQGHHNNGSNVINMLDINGGVGGGGSNSGGGLNSINVKTEIPNLETGTSILQEKLSQIKAEQQESEENL